MNGKIKTKRNKNAGNRSQTQHLLLKLQKALRLKQRVRQALSLVFIYALVFTPLLSIDGVIQEARAQIIIEFCNQTYASRIFQFCPLDSPVETTLTEQAITDVLALYELPASDRPLLLKHARNEVRAQLYVRFLEMINKQNPTPDEQRAIAAFAQRIKEKRIESAQKAKAEYDRFQSTSCRTYRPPSPYTYNAGYGCYSPLAGVFSRSSPSFEEFQNFGAALAYEDFATPEAQSVTTQTTQGIVAGTGIAAAGIGAAAAAAIGSTVTFGTLSAIVPFAGLSFATVSAATASGTAVVATLPAAGAASGAVGASAAAGPAAIILLAVVAAVMEGINVANQVELPGKLDQAIADKQNETIDLRALAGGDDAQKQEVYGAFIRITLPEFPDNEAITPNQSDPIFTVSTANAAATDSNSMAFLPWDGNALNLTEARLSGRSWFLVRSNNNPNAGYRLRLAINYQGENGELLTARRRGREFVVTSPGNPNATVVTDTLKTRFADTVYSYKVKPNAALLAVAGASKADVGCGFRNFDGNESFFTVILGRILDTGATAPNQLALSVNGGTQATVGNITLKNLSVQTFDGVNYIAARASTDTAAFGESSNFTIKVANNSEDTQFTTTIKKTAILDTLPNKLPANLTVGTNYSFSLNTAGNIITFGQCPGFSYSVTGELPAGLTFVNNHPDGGNESANNDVKLVGTAASDGDYKFTINKNYTNGEVLSRSYRMTVRGNLAEIPAGVKSWWRAENNAEDFTNRANGTMNGAATFINGKVSRGFYFRGTNGFVALPDNAFQIASSSQTFETWFKTGANGVILGRQNANITPYGSAQNLSRPLLYVDRSGKLRVGFGNGESIVVSPNAVNNNAYHHVAVTFSESGGGAVYLDGVSIGANNGRAFTGTNQKFQFGTGFINPGVTGELSGWSNFTGTIDEPAIYDQILSAAQIRAIYAAGAGGKISVSAQSTPPTQRDGSNGTITINAQGGVRQLSYSINNGATFQTTNFFQNLTPGTYQIVVRDGGDRDVRRTVTITNPAPNLSFTTQVTPPQCFGGNAEIVIFPSGGSGNYEYSVSNGANRRTTNVFNDIGAGDYIPWLRDVNSDTTYTNGTINIPQPAQIAVSPASFPNAALNQPYSQTFTVSGGTPGYSIGVSGDAQTNFQLPAGLTSTVSGSTFTISGTPTQTGTFRLFFEIYDQNNCRQGIFAPPLTIISTATYGISGRATNGGQALANVTVTLAGAENRTTTTDANGNYSFATVAGAANYTVTATLNDAVFAQPTITLNNLSANLTAVDFALAATTYEGDFAPRRGGDGAINVLDLVALGRTLIPNNPDARPANGAEFQRADSDPRSNLGNAVINADDLTQIRNYILGTNQKVPAGGAIAPAPPAANQAPANETSFFVTPELDLPNLKVDFSNAAAAGTATVSADTIAYNGSGNAVVPIRMTTNGGVQAAQFTISYDPTRLSPSSVVNQAPANTTVTTTGNGVGKITVVVNQPIDGTSVFPNGTFELMRINFAPVQNVPSGFGRIDFTDAPTTRVASDSQANAVTLSANPGGVSFSPDAISGKVTNGGQGLSNVTVHLETLGRTTVTDASGNYFFGNLPTGGNYTIRAELNGYTFAPPTLAFNNFNANVTNADFSTSQASYEGDIAGRPTGDGAINGQDTDALGRIIANRETAPANGGEWQRADVAPAASFGDGAVNVRDLVQLGRYISGSVLIPASGAINAAQPPASMATEQEEALSEITDAAPFADDLFDNAENGKSLNLLDRLTDDAALDAAENLAVGAATVSAASAAASNGVAAVPIRLNSSGDAAAIQFTVNYDPAKLSIPNEAAIVSRLPNTTFVFNTDTPGKLGVVAYRALDGTSVFQTGDSTLFNINFAVASNAGGSTSISFGDIPIPQTAANPQAEAVPLLDTPGTVSMLAPTAASVTVGGRVTVGERGLANASVKLTGQNGAARLARTNAFGFYRFTEAAAGETYLITVASKNYSFEPLVTVILADADDLNFAALP